MKLMRMAVVVVAAGVCAVALAACCCLPSSPTSGEISSTQAMSSQFAQELRPTQAAAPQLAPVQK